ncbi:MAG: hypothetical protein KIS91_12190 [Anaerolineae bacterium]|nr:hypothetical protein [Anaerolineae bacterium]
MTSALTTRLVVLGMLLLTSLGLSACGESASARPSNATDQGAALVREFGCLTCHAVSKSETGQKLGPMLAGLYGTTVRLADGREVTADDAYLRQSILQPDAATVEGYSAGVMAAGIERHKARIAAGGTVDALLAYIKSLE